MQTVFTKMRNDRSARMTTVITVLAVVIILANIAYFAIDYSPRTSDGQNPVTVTYTPKQCVEDPWSIWLANSGIRFIRAPTESEVISMYYSQVYNITVSDYKRISLGQLTCEACGVCIKGYEIQLKVPQSALDIMISDGWTSS